jgi:hypothetical protein
MIFLASVSRGLQDLADDGSYPRVLKVFAQYIRPHRLRVSPAASGLVKIMY